MYPLKLKPAIKDYLWGGTKLKDEFGYETDKEISAEAWVFSCHKDGENIVMNGEMEGKTLGISALGQRCHRQPRRRFLIFPYFNKAY